MGPKKSDEVKGVSGGSSEVKHTLSEQVKDGQEIYHHTSFSSQGHMSYDQDKTTGAISGLHLTVNDTDQKFDIPVTNQNMGDVVRDLFGLDD